MGTGASQQQSLDLTGREDMSVERMSQCRDHRGHDAAPALLLEAHSRQRRQLAARYLFHDLRHCAATKMIARGIDIVTVKEVLGHSDIRMTARYAHATNGAKRRAVEKLAETGAPRDSKVTKEKGRRAGLPKS